MSDNPDGFWDISMLPIVVEVDSDLGPGIFSNVQIATEEWNQTIGDEIFTVRTFDIQDVISDGILRDPPLGHIYVYGTELGRSSTGELILGLARRDFHRGEIISGVVFLDDDLIISSSYVVMLHELGHMLNLGHDTDDIDSIMNPHPLAGTGFIREDDIQWIRSRLTCQSSP